MKVHKIEKKVHYILIIILAQIFTQDLYHFPTQIISYTGVCPLIEQHRFIKNKNLRKLFGFFKWCTSFVLSYPLQPPHLISLFFLLFFFFFVPSPSLHQYSSEILNQITIAFFFSLKRTILTEAFRRWHLKFQCR